MREDKRLIFAGAINVGIVFPLVWFLINQASKVVGGIGILEKQPWPLSSIYACSVIGALLGTGLGIALVIARRQRSEQTAALAERMGFEFVRDVPRNDLTRYHGLQLFKRRHFHEVRNLMKGNIDGVEFAVLDYEYIEPGSEGDDTNYRHTVALFPDGAQGLPRFVLWTGDLMLKFLEKTAGFKGITFEPDGSISAQDREVVERFSRSYFLSPPLGEVREAWEEQRVREELGTIENGTHVSPIIDSQYETALRERFHLDTLRFLSERAGWSVESDGEHLAIWRNKKIIPAARREKFLYEANEIRAALLTTASNPAAAQVLKGSVSMPRPTPERGAAGLLGAVIGFFAGSGVGFAAVALVLPLEPSTALGFAVFFGPPVVGIILGAIIGQRRHRNRALVRAASKRSGEETESPCEAQVIQTDESTSTVTVQIGGEEIAMDCRPLTGTSHASFRDTRLIRGTEWLELRPSKRSYLFGLFVLGMGVGFAVLGFHAPGIWQGWPFGPGKGLVRIAVQFLQPACWLAALLFTGAGLLFLFGREGARFEQNTGRFFYESKTLWRRSSRPLSDLCAVQFIPGETHSYGVGGDPPYRSYQLNLVLNDPNERRVNLCDNTDVAWLHESGQQIANFTNRPLVDMVSGKVMKAGGDEATGR